MPSVVNGWNWPFASSHSHPIETRIDGTEERKNNTERGKINLNDREQKLHRKNKFKNSYVDMLMLAGQTSSFVMNSKTWLTYFTRNTCWSFLRA